jgi:hypothetical protein
VDRALDQYTTEEIEEKRKTIYQQYIDQTNKSGIFSSFSLFWLFSCVLDIVCFAHFFCVSRKGGVFRDIVKQDEYDPFQKVTDIKYKTKKINARDPLHKDLLKVCSWFIWFPFFSYLLSCLLSDSF